jgi:hypothetical protein
MDGTTAEDVVGTVTVTDSDPEEGANVAAPPYDAEIGLAPTASWLPFTVIVAVAVPPEPERLAVPRAVFPELNDTCPAGEAVPLAALTVAVSTVLAPATTLGGFALTVVVVAIAAGVDPPPAH